MQISRTHPNTVTSLPESQVHVGYVKIMTIMLFVLELSIPRHRQSVFSSACNPLEWTNSLRWNEVSRAFSRLSKSTVMASYRRLTLFTLLVLGYYTETITTPRQHLLQLLLGLPSAQLRYDLAHKNKQSSRPACHSLAQWWMRRGGSKGACTVQCTSTNRVPVHAASVKATVHSLQKLP